MDNTTREAWTGGKNISPEARAKRKKINRKILTFGCLPITVIIIIIAVLVVNIEPPEAVPPPPPPNDPMALGIDSLQTFVGHKMDTTRFKTVFGSISEYESPAPYASVYYLDSANVSLVTIDSKISFAGFDLQSGLTYAQELENSRQKLIEKQFDPWDGSHIQLTKIIKQSMNDPDSYEHVKTNYWDMSDHLVVKTTFRGKNAFGGKVLNSVRAEADISTGQISNISQE